MSSAQELLNNAEIAGFIANHQGAKVAVESAAEILANKQDAAEALKKLLPALERKVIKVFFSYKTTDEAAATEVVKVLRQNSAEKLDITYQHDFTKEIAGVAWRQVIRERVREANWFILLLPHPSGDLDWCLYETGLFEAQLTPADRLICIHHPDDDIPSPIEGYDAVPATVPKMVEFLRMVFTETDPVPGLPPINRAIETLIPGFALQIVDAIKAPYHREPLAPYIELRLEGADKLKTKEDLDAAAIEHVGTEALALFGYREKKSTFGDLRKRIAEGKGDGRWREELFQVIRKIARGELFHPIQAVFQSPEGGKFYRPVAYAIDRFGRDGPVKTYHFTFVEEVTNADNAVMPRQLALLTTLLRFAFRFRWEVLERFSKENLNDDEIQRLEVALTRITVDWASRGTIEATAVFDLYPGRQADRVREMTDAWHRLRKPDKTGELDIAIKENDGRKIPTLLASFLPLNQEFLEMTAERFAQMIGEQHVQSMWKLQSNERGSTNQAASLSVRAKYAVTA